MAVKRRPKHRGHGFNLVEVMVAVGVLAVGATGILGIQVAAIRGNQEAQEMATASRIVEMWLERFRLDALGWGPGGVAGLANASYLRAIPATGTTGWFEPVSTNPAFRFPLPDAHVLPYTGNPSAAPGAPQPVFCTQVNLQWVYNGSAIRVDVRTYWRKRGPAGVRGPLACNAGREAIDLTQFHVVRGSTLVRWNPESPRRQTAP
ncbi:MAG: prepilin-type N-terminal cleavage/methylation domain-containing protein [Deltaproteobacteria bacterium]|nr:prepilin-type N-terminal cleavage/methylation domain-containing protein [Sandaracinaceae bacterium]MCX7808664.1 prepilin-type N-terminal cleavage/methylation domain-containing protein [Deltaproteobacteria bacterium]